MTELYETPGHLIRRMHQISHSAFATETAAAGFDLTPVQYAALSALRTHPGVDQARLAGLIAYDRATIGGVIARLEARALIERNVSETDRRSRRLRLTAAGAALLEAIRPAVLQAQRSMLEGLSAEEGAALVALLRKATDAGNEISRAPLRPLRIS